MRNIKNELHIVVYSKNKKKNHKIWFFFSFYGEKGNKIFVKKFFSLFKKWLIKVTILGCKNERFSIKWVVNGAKWSKVE